MPTCGSNAANFLLVNPLFNGWKANAKLQRSFPWLQQFLGRVFTRLRFEFLAIWSGILQVIAQGVKRALEQCNQIENHANIDQICIGFD